jgi:hypothetical protein
MKQIIFHSKTSVAKINITNSIDSNAAKAAFKQNLVVLQHFLSICTRMQVKLNLSETKDTESQDTQDVEGTSINVKIKRSVKMKRLFQAHCKRMNYDLETTCFFYQGERTN